MFKLNLLHSKLLILLFFITLSILTKGQSFVDAVPFKNYKNWMMKIKIPGYLFSQVEIDGNAQDHKQYYIAAFKKGKSLLAISYGSEKEYLSYENAAGTSSPNVYHINNHPVVYYPIISAITTVSIISVWIPELKASFSISVSELKMKDEMESLLNNFDLTFFDKYKSLPPTTEIQKDTLPSTIAITKIPHTNTKNKKHKLNPPVKETPKDTIAPSIVITPKPIYHESSNDKWGKGNEKPKSKLLEQRKDTIKTSGTMLWWY